MQSLLFLLFLTSSFIPSLRSEITKLTPPLPDESEGYQHLERFIDILENVRAHHPDADNLSYERLINHALEGMVASLDPFSGFYHLESATGNIVEETNTPEALNLPDLGITLILSEEEVTIDRVHPNSPAERVKLQKGDRPLNLNGNPLPTPDPLATHRALQGSPGETLVLDVLRPSQTDPQSITVTLIRPIIREEAITDAFLLTEQDSSKIGYLRLREFSASTFTETQRHLNRLEDDGMESLILDLRQNPGGLLDQAVALLSLFLPPNTEVVTVQGRSPQASIPAMKTLDGKIQRREYPLCVLIDQNSASASELVAGALQDLERATIIGETSYGKGSVQRIAPAGYHTTLRLTFATYHTPSGRTPHKIGVTPDLIVPYSKKDRLQFERFTIRDQLSSSDLAQLNKWKDPILTTALEKLLKQE